MALTLSAPPLGRLCQVLCWPRGGREGESGEEGPSCLRSVCEIETHTQGPLQSPLLEGGISSPAGQSGMCCRGGRRLVCENTGATGCDRDKWRGAAEVRCQVTCHGLRCQADGDYCSVCQTPSPRMWIPQGQEVCLLTSPGDLARHVVDVQ